MRFTLLLALVLACMAANTLARPTGQAGVAPRSHPIVEPDCDDDDKTVKHGKTDKTPQGGPFSPVGGSGYGQYAPPTSKHSGDYHSSGHHSSKGGNPPPAPPSPPTGGKPPHPPTTPPYGAGPPSSPPSPPSPPSPASPASPPSHPSPPSPPSPPSHPSPPSPPSPPTGGYPPSPPSPPTGGYPPSPPSPPTGGHPPPSSPPPQQGDNTYETPSSSGSGGWQGSKYAPIEWTSSTVQPSGGEESGESKHPDVSSSTSSGSAYSSDPYGASSGDGQASVNSYD